MLVFIVVVISTALIYFNYNFQFWTHYQTDNFEALVAYNGINIEGYRGKQILVHKEFKKYIIQIDRYAINHKVKLIINQGYRSNKQMLSHTIVEPATISNHLAGFAIDFNLICQGKKYYAHDLKKSNLSKLPKNIQGFIHDIQKNKELRWGGDFRNEDPVHIDYPLNIKNYTHWRECYQTCNLDDSRKIPKWNIWR
jgi:hypothetical protein